MVKESKHRALDRAWRLPVFVIALIIFFSPIWGGVLLFLYGAHRIADGHVTALNVLFLILGVLFFAMIRFVDRYINGVIGFSARLRRVSRPRGKNGF